MVSMIVLLMVGATCCAMQQPIDPHERDAHGQTPLHRWSSSDGLAYAQQLLDKGADPNARDNVGCTPLHCAALQNNIEFVRLLLANGAQVNAQMRHSKYTPLGLAAIAPGSEQIILCLLNNNAHWDDALLARICDQKKRKRFEIILSRYEAYLDTILESL